MDDASRYRKFWTQLLAQPGAKEKLRLAFKPQGNWYISAPSGVPGLIYNLALRKNDSYVEFWIDVGDRESNEQLFLALQYHRASIESEFGGPLIWNRAGGGAKRSRAVQRFISSGGFDNQDAWPAVQTQLLDAAIRLERALRPRLL